jgi:hypothetical protein
MIRIILACILITSNVKSSLRCHEKDSVTIPSKIFSEIVDNKAKIYDNSKDKNDDVLIKSDASLFFFRNKENDEIIAMDISSGAETVYLFHEKSIPSKLLKYYNELESKNGISTDNGMITNMTAKEFIRNKLKYADTLDVKYFKTKKGVSLEMNSKEIINVYGPPNIMEDDKSNNIKRYIWHVYSKYDEYTKKMNTTKCDNIDEGYDYIVDFKKLDDQDESIFIYIEHRMP